MRGFMIDVLGPQGTAKGKQSHLYKMYGKTGTAHIAASGASQGHAYDDKNEYNSSFLCGAPVDHPRLVLIVTLHKPNYHLGYYAGSVSAPAAGAKMERAHENHQVPSEPFPEYAHNPAGTPDHHTGH